jgi:hypothetical protein
MHELWKGSTGERLTLAGSYETVDAAWGWFVRAANAAARNKRGSYLELRRPDGSCYARFTVQLDASPDPGSLG